MSATLPTILFGPGSLYVSQLGVSNPTPVNIGYALEFSIDLSGDTKELFGQNQFPLDAARATVKATGKIKAATFYGLAINAVFFGQTFADGQLLMSQGQSGTVPTVTDKHFTPTVPGSGTYDKDLGVLYASSGLPFLRVGSGSESTGAYSVNEASGIYDFAAADSGIGVLFTYAYTQTTGGQTFTVNNTPIGDSPFFQIDYATIHNGEPYYCRIYRAIASKMSWSHKLTDYAMPEFDFSFFATAAGKVYEISYPQGT